MSADAGPGAVVTALPLPGRRRRRTPQSALPLWYVTLTVSGDPVDPALVRAGLERLAHERPFVASAAYAADRAEVCYWEESPDAAGAVTQALRLWGDHRASAGLPPWAVAGVEVVDRHTARSRWRHRGPARPQTLGEIVPLDARR